MENLEWSECNESLDDILKNPRVQLPQLIKLSSQIVDINSKESVSKEQILVIHSKNTINNIQGVDSKGKAIKIPVGCPHKVRRKVTPGKEKVYNSVNDLAKSEPLPRFVEVKSAQNVENVSNGDRLKVVIVEKTGGVPSVIHFRSSNGKHVKISVEENISFVSSVSDGSEQSVEKLSQKSREFPLSAEFQQKANETPNTHIGLETFTISKCGSVEVVIASAVKEDVEYALVFPLDSDFKFQINSKLKMAKDEEYRELCKSSSNINPHDIVDFLNHASPTDDYMQYILKFTKLQKILKFDYSNESDSSPKNPVKLTKKEKKESTKKEKEKEKLKEKNESPREGNERKVSPVQTLSEEVDEPFEDEPLPPNTLVMDSEQKEILKREIKEKERQAKLEKEQLKAEKKREKKMKKEKEKEEKRKKKLSTASISSPTPASPSSPDMEFQSEDLYIVPQEELNKAQEENCPGSPKKEDEQQSQLAIYLMSKVKKVRDRTTSLGFKPKNKKRNKLRKEDIEYVSSDNLGPSNLPASNMDESYYTGLSIDDEAISEDLYEALPGEMAYESLDLVAQVQRSLAPIPTENSGDSGFDEIDQARIQAWRDAMAPPPLPGNHPLQNNPTPLVEEENMYETAVDCKKAAAQLPGQNAAAWQNFYDSVQQSTSEIATWDMEDVASCLEDLFLSDYVEVFTDSQVDGQLLLDLDESVLKDLGLNAFEARKLRKFVFGWRPDMIRPPTYPKLQGFDSKDPAQWSQDDVVKHIKTIEINDFAEFCQNNQVNGELLKDVCVDDTIMSTIIKTKDRKLKSVKIKNYVIDQWRPKKKGEGNYVSSNSILPPEKRSVTSPNVNKISPKTSTGSSPKTPSKSASGGDAPMIARMKQQLEENKNNWEKRIK